MSLRNLRSVRFVRRERPADRVIFVGHRTFLAAQRLGLVKEFGTSVVLVTHLEEGEMSLAEGLKDKTRAKTIFACMNSHEQRHLSSMGLRTALVLGGVEDIPTMPIQWRQRQYSAIGSIDVKPRKNVQLLMQILKEFGQESIVFVRNDADAVALASVNQCKHLQIVPFSWANYSRTLGNSRCVLSTSNIEGGPMPLIEGLKQGCKFVASDVGFAADLIQLTGIGITIPPGSPLETWIAALHEAQKEAPTPTHELDQLSLDAFCDRLIRLADASFTITGET